MHLNPLHRILVRSAKMTPISFHRHQPTRCNYHMDTHNSRMTTSSTYTLSNIRDKQAFETLGGSDVYEAIEEIEKSFVLYSYSSNIFFFLRINEIYSAKMGRDKGAYPINYSQLLISTDVNTYDKFYYGDGWYCIRTYSIYR